MRSGTWAIGVTLLAVGCSSRPGAIRPPSVNPSRAARAAIEQYDRDGDGLLSEAEWSASPELSAVAENYDTSADRVLSADEIEDGIRIWQEGPVGARAVLFRVTMGGRPLSGATVRLVPAEFLGDSVKGAAGETNQSGAGNLSMAPEDRPRNAPNVALVQPGLYRVEITHPSNKIPEKYNANTVLGIEISGANPGPEGVTWQLSRS
jgi:hypothetical protein